jgi:hypothetical protein
MFPDTFKGLSAVSAQALRDLGPRWSEDIVANRKVVLDIYTPVLSARSLEGIEVRRDVAYGPHERQVLDIYHDSRCERPQGVVLFVHGGAFIRGDKDANEHIYANFLTYFVRHGYVGINLEYRQAPEATYPEGSKDIELAVSWLQAHAQELNITAAPIFLVGHSAGGSHAATYVLDPAVTPPQGHGVHALILISARLRADVRADNPNAHGVKAYYGQDPQLYPSRSPLTHAERLDVPLFIAIAEFENPGLDVYAAELFHHVSHQHWRSPTFIQVPGHNHTSIVAHLDTEEDSLGLMLRGFMQKCMPSR